MRSIGICVRRAALFGSAALALVLTFGGARAAEEKTYVMKVTLPTLNDTLHNYAKGFAARVERLSGGRIKGEVYPASQLGPIPRTIEGVQFGAIQAAVIPPEFYVGIDERFEMMTAPGLIDSMAQGQRLAADPEVQKLMLGLGANKGLRGVALFLSTPSSIVAKKAVRRLDDFKGKKLRIFASEFQFEALKRLGATPVAMTLGDVLPAIQQGAIDGAVAALTVYVPMRYQDAAKYVTETNQPAIFAIVEVSRKWYDALPKDLQQAVDKAAAEQATETAKGAEAFVDQMRKMWIERGGELIHLPPDEQAAMLKMFSSVGDDVSKHKPAVAAAYKIVKDAAARAK